MQNFTNGKGHILLKCCKLFSTSCYCPVRENILFAESLINIHQFKITIDTAGGRIVWLNRRRLMKVMFHNAAKINCFVRPGLSCHLEAVFFFFYREMFFLHFALLMFHSSPM